MSEPTPDQAATVLGKVLQLTGAPFSVTQSALWHQRVDGAYRELSHHPAFRLVLEHWTVTVLLNPDADEGARRLVIEILQSMNALNQQPMYEGD